MYRILFKMFLAVVLLAAIAGLGVFAYQAGLAQGVAQNAQLPAPAGGLPAPVYPYYPGMWYGHPFFGFGFLSCLGPLFLLFLAFAALRGLLWHGHGGWGRMHHGPWGRRDWQGEVPPPVQEWHRKMHEDAGSQTSTQSGSDQV